MCNYAHNVSIKGRYFCSFFVDVCMDFWDDWYRDWYHDTTQLCPHFNSFSTFTLVIFQRFLQQNVTLRAQQHFTRKYPEGKKKPLFSLDEVQRHSQTSAKTPFSSLQPTGCIMSQLCAVGGRLSCVISRCLPTPRGKTTRTPHHVSSLPGGNARTWAPVVAGEPSKSGNVLAEFFETGPFHLQRMSMYDGSFRCCGHVETVQV